MLRKPLLILAGLALAAGCRGIKEEAPTPAAVPTVLISLVSDSGTGNVALPVLGVAYNVRFAQPTQGKLVFEAAHSRYRYIADSTFTGRDSAAYTVTFPSGAAAQSGIVRMRLADGVCLPEAILDTTSLQLRDTVGGDSIAIPVLANDRRCASSFLFRVRGIGPTTGRWVVRGDKVVYTSYYGRYEADSAHYSLKLPSGFCRIGTIRIQLKQPHYPPPAVHRVCDTFLVPHPDTIVLDNAHRLDTNLPDSLYPLKYEYPESVVLGNDSVCAINLPSLLPQSISDRVQITRNRNTHIIRVIIYRPIFSTATPRYTFDYFLNLSGQHRKRSTITLTQ